MKQKWAIVSGNYILMKPPALLFNGLLLKVILVEPSSGHLPSSNLYPTYRAPYLVLLACSDENVRFYECLRITESNESICYKWKMWRMISNTTDSNIEMDGEDFFIRRQAILYFLILLVSFSWEVNQKYCFCH